MSIDLQQIQASALERWKEAFGGILDTMAGIKPDLPPAETPDEEEIGVMLWWRQDFSGPQGFTVWVGAPSHTWTRSGQLVLSGAGIEAAPEADVRESFLEVLKQTFLIYARALGTDLAEEIACAQGREEAPPSKIPTGWVGVHPPSEVLPPLFVRFSDPLLQALLHKAQLAEAEAAALPAEADSGSDYAPEDPADALPDRARSTLDILLDVEMPVHVSFGKTRTRIQDVLRFGSGSVIELDRGISEPVEIVVNNCVIARGAVVVVNGNYAVQISEVASRNERLRQGRRFMLPQRVTAQ